LYAKAASRSKKLEKTLAKIIDRNEPRSDIEALLKDVRRGRKLLRKGETTPLPPSDGSDQAQGQVDLGAKDGAREGAREVATVEAVGDVAESAPKGRTAPRRAAASRTVAEKGSRTPRRTRAAPKPV
ncbi:MAG: hypothetical protein ABW026_10500, partial [Microvirga sp.]